MLSGEYLYSCFPGTSQQAINDGLRIVGDGKHAAIGFGLQLYSSVLKPLHSIGWAETVKWAEQCFFTPWVVLHQFPGFEAVVGHVAAPATGYLDFLQDPFSFFQNGDLYIRIGFCSCNGSEEPGCTAADNEDLGG